MKYLSTIMLLFALALSGCAEQGNTTPISESNPEEPVNPDPDVPDAPLQDFLRTGANASLNERAIVDSGVYDDLTVERYPLMLMIVREVGVLESYIAAQGLSEEDFLTHPKLPEFIKSHLIYEEIDMLKLRTTPDASVTFESAAGTEIVIKNEPTPRMGSANGVPLSLDCAEGRDITYMTDAVGLLCTVAEPIVQDFDWSR